MNKLIIAINNYLSSKQHIKEQIKREEGHIKESIEEINTLMQNDICLLNLKVYGNYSALDRCYNAIVYHQTNIEKLKKGDFELCKELIEHEKNLEKQKQIKARREASLSSEELKLYREGKLYISWKDDYYADDND